MRRTLWTLALVLCASGCGDKDADSGVGAAAGGDDGGVGGGSGTDGADGGDGTDGADGGTGSDGGDDAYPSCRASEGDAFETLEVAVAGDELAVTVAYSGGCADHLFTLCWPESTFLESEPVQVNLELLHDGMADACDAYPSETRTFDLEPLAEAWRDSYRAESGTIIINLHGHSVEYSF
jgi:hypothetical protein